MSVDGATIPHMSLTQRTANTLMSDILSGALGETDSLPAVRVLSERYGVSSLVIREALAHLQAQGLLERRQGRRTRIVKPDHTAITAVLRFSAHQEESALDELQACRAGLEVKAAELAALADNDEKEAALRPILEGMANAKSRKTFNKYDLAFHLAVAKLSGNRPIEMVLAALSDVTREVLDVTYSRVADREGEQGIRTALDLHEAVAAAILKGNGTAAAAAMGKHFAYSAADH